MKKHHRHAPLKRIPRPDGPSARRLIVRFAIACLLTFGGEQWLDHAIESSGQPHNVLTQSVFGIAGVYHRIVTASPRKPVPRFTALVALGDHDSPPGVSLLNVCHERLFLGELLKSLLTANPTVIVVDKYFGTDTCPDGDEGTRSLLEGLQAACARNTPVVVGRLINEESRRKDVPVYPLNAALRLNPPAGCVAEGLVNTHPDLRRVGLWWPNVEPITGSDQAPPSMALAAALALSPGLLQSGRIAGWSADRPAPYVSLVRLPQFEPWRVSSRDAVCDSPQPPGWRACLQGELKSVVQQAIRGRTVVIGEDLPDVDRHETVVGDVPGYTLQANYIESLLDDRLIRPVPDSINWIYGLLIYFAFEYIVWHYHHQQLRGLLWTVVLFAGAGVSIYLAVTLAGYYLNPVMISFLAVLIRVADLAIWPAQSGSGEVHS